MRFRLKSGLAVGYSVQGAGPAIVLLHPIGLRGAFWAPVAELLSHEYRVISIDFRGHGDSDVPSAPYSLAELADDVLELLEALVGPSIVMGCSMGSAVAQSMAAKNPKLVKAAIFANGSGPRPGGGGGHGNALELRAQRAAQGMPMVLAETLDRWFTKDFMAKRPEIVARIADILLAGDPTVHGWGWLALANRDDAYSRIAIPTLAITGSEDQSAPPASVKALAEAVPGCRYAEVAGTGHMAVVEKPYEFTQAVREFLRGVAA